MDALRAEAGFKRMLEAYFKDPSNMNLLNVTIMCRLLEKTHGDGAKDAYDELVGWYFDHWPPEKTHPVYAWEDQLGL